VEPGNACTREAVGWDWIGINLMDGSALTAFRLRNKQGYALWDGGSFRTREKLFTFRRGEVEFKAQRTWKSPLSQASYPVEWMVRTPADFYTVRAWWITRSSTAALPRVPSTGKDCARSGTATGRLVGRGYLEMTGYAAPIRM